MNESLHIHHPACLLLAAGQSRRLGRPKQMLEWEGDTLLSKSVDAARGLAGIPLAVVLGAHADRIRPLLDEREVLIINNPGWLEGMASSIRAGLAEITRRHPNADGVIIMVCDQPGLDTTTLSRLIELQRSSGKPVAAAAYAGRLGTPVIFHRSVFTELLQLEGDKGARQLLMTMAGQVAVLPFEAGALDIDTEEDYQRFISPTGE